MALAIAHDELVTTNSTLVQLVTNSFTAPAGSRLWAFGHWDIAKTALIDFSDSSLYTWTKAFDGHASGGRVACGWANVPGGGFSGTVTATCDTFPQFPGAALYVMVVTGGEPTVGGATVFNEPAATWVRTLNITTTKANSLIVAAATGFAGGTDWTPGANQTELATHFSAGNYQAEVWRYNGFPAIGTYTLSCGTTSEIGQMGIVEIREGPVGPTVTAELWENGVLKQSLGTAQVTVDGIFSFTWDAATLAALSGANVELRLSSNSGMDVGAVEWNAMRAVAVGAPPTVVEMWGAIAI